MGSLYWISLNFEINQHTHTSIQTFQITEKLTSATFLDEDNEESPPKDRQSLVIPEKSSSFSIHPERLCADVCCYCFGKFGSLDTPMHLAQMKSDDRRKKILNVERHLTKDSCLCDACYRHVDRKVLFLKLKKVEKKPKKVLCSNWKQIKKYSKKSFLNFFQANTSPTNIQTKPQRHRQLMVAKCEIRSCREAARHYVKRRWLLKIKHALRDQVIIEKYILSLEALFLEDLINYFIVCQFRWM